MDLQGYPLFGQQPDACVSSHHAATRDPPAPTGMLDADIPCLVAYHAGQ